MTKVRFGKTKSLNLEQDYLLAAASAHVFVAMAVIFVGLYFGVPVWISVIAILIYAGIKEGIVDPWKRFEGNPFWVDGSFDCGFWDSIGYVSGIGLAWLVLWVPVFLR